MRVLITMRVLLNAKNGEYQDAISHAWVEHLANQGHTVLTVPNSTHLLAKKVSVLKPDLIIFTGGDDLITSPQDEEQFIFYKRDVFENHLLKWALKNNVPCLGTCRGAELIFSYYGGQLVPVSVKDHVNSEHAIVAAHPTRSFFPNKLKVNSFHRWGLSATDNLKNIQPLLFAKDNTIEAFCHRTAAVMGIMWHPERSFSNKATQNFHNKNFYKSLVKFLKNRTRI